MLALLASTVMLLPQSVPTIADKTKGLDRRDGLFATYVSPSAGTVYLELPPAKGEEGLCAEVLYTSAIRSGLGSNDVGLDRGQLGPSYVLRMRRVGNRVLFTVPNLGFRARTDDANERRAVEQSFAGGVLWAGPVVAADEDGRSLIDLSTFLVRDAHDTAGSLRRGNQGSFSLDKDRSVIEFTECKAFPNNLEFEATLTFGSSQPGGFVRQTAAVPEALAMLQHQSLVALPGPGYETRRFDPRIGAFGISFLDYAAPIDQPIQTRWISRHRLQLDAQGRVIEPIVYYVDNGAPEPIRSALVEGASWWADAFARAGFPGGFLVKVLPEGADPLDARYNTIQWVHRSTRGWSYGSSIDDPRTGEIIKGHVSLGSLRVRQDRLLFEGLLGTANTGKGGPDDPVQISLSRIRQLAAHEVGHTLGLSHNYAASTYGRASVMDYPAPLVTVRDGKLDCSDAYAVGMGAYDVYAVNWMYRQGLSQPDLDALAAKAPLFLSDSDARDLGTSDPRAALWDNLADPVAGLRNTIAVRRIGLEQFGEDRIAPGRPMAELQEVFAPLYLWHRYQVEAAVKVVGGVEYDFAVRGDGREPTRRVPATKQHEALNALLECVQPGFLRVPEPIVRLLAPRPFGSGGNREMFGGATNPTFDPISAAATAADLVYAGVLHPARLGRCHVQAAAGAGPSEHDVLTIVVADAFPGAPQHQPRDASIRFAVQNVLVARLFVLAQDASALPAVRAAANAQLRRLTSVLPNTDQGMELRSAIKRYLERPWEPAPLSPPPAAPPGSPIGDCGGWF